VLGGKMVKDVHQLAFKFEVGQSECKASKVITSMLTQVGKGFVVTLSM